MWSSLRRVLSAAEKGGNTQAVLASDTQVLEYADLESSISATGTVESSDTTKVYSALAYQVKSVLVEVGDIVKEGDLLAELDGEQIENQIATQKTSMEVASAARARRCRARMTHTIILSKVWTRGSTRA